MKLRLIRWFGNSEGKGEHNSKNTNMLIFGDNLVALRLLLSYKQIKGNVRLIYIDPPFSTKTVFRISGKRGTTVSAPSDGKLAYQDLLSGSEYLSFLKKRLELLKELLAEDGSIYVHIDTKIGHYVKILMDQVFGIQNFINDITRIKCNPKNFSRRAYGNIKDMILFYSKTGNHVWNDPRDAYTEADIRRLFPKIDRQGRRYTTVPLHAPGETRNGPTGSAWRGIKPPKGRHWRYSPDELERLDRAGRIEWSKNNVPRLIIFANEKQKKGKKLQDIWEFKDPQYPRYPTQKNIELLRLIVSASSNPNDIVIDAFSGSGTTLLAAQELGRQWIGIDSSPEAIKITIERMQSRIPEAEFGLYCVEGLTSECNVELLFDEQRRE